MLKININDNSIAQNQYNIVMQSSQYMFTTVKDIELTLSNNDTITIPKGFNTDLASAPRFLWSIFRPYGNYTLAAIVHDYMYVIGYANKKFADREFYRIMKACNANRFKRLLMYWGAILFGRGNY